MTALAADRFVKYESASGPYGVVALPVADNTLIYKGSLVCLNTAGYAVPAADTAGYQFVGLAEEHADNTVPGHAAGAINVRVQSGMVFLAMTTSGASQASAGQPVYVTDSGTVGFTSANGIYVGNVLRYNSATSVDVYLPSVGVMSRLLPPPTIAAGAIATGATLTPAAAPWSKITINPGSAVTGIILAAGTFDGQEVEIVNIAAAANTATFAAATTSHVADGTSDAIAGLSSRGYIWDAGSTLWYHES